MSFRTEIEAITGSISSLTSEANLYLAEGVKFITKYVMSNPLMIERLTQSSTLNSSTPQHPMSGVLGVSSVVRSDGTRTRNADEISPEFLADLSDVNSIYFTNKFDPKYYVSDNILKVYPLPSDTEQAIVKHITPDASVANTDSSVSNFPTELNRGVVLYGAQQVLRKFMSVRNATLTGLTSGLGSINPPSSSGVVSTVTYSGPSNGDVGTASAASVSSPTAVSASNKINIGSAPAYSKQANYNMTAIASISDLNFSGITPPSSIGIGSVTYSTPTDANVGSMGDVAAGFNTAVVSTGAANVGSAPNYSAPSIVGTGSVLLATPSIQSLTISVTPPSAPNVADVGIGALGSAPAYAPPSLSLDYTAPGDLGVDDYLTSEDVELAQIALQKVASDINKYQIDVQNQANEFNENMAVYQANLQKILAQGQIESTESEQGIQKYSQEIASFTADINKQIGAYQQNTTKDITLWETTRQTQLAQYASDIENQSVVFNANVEKFRADNQSALDKTQRDLQASISNAQNDLAEAQVDAASAQDKQARQFAEKSERLIQGAIQTMQATLGDNQSKIEQFNSLLSKYQSEINTKVTEHQQNTNKEIAKAELLRTTELQQYTIAIQDELNEFNKENVAYQANIQAEFDKVQRDLQALIADAQNDLAAAQQTAEQTTSVSIQNQSEKSQRLIQNAINTMQAIVTHNQAKVETYNVDVAKYQAEVAEAVQDYTLSLQEVTQDYTWLKEQYGIVTNDLITFLQPYLPQQQMQEAQNEIAANG
tara:strand:+ start:18321 stop:20630 length:2310 start_codon:yes stop_codon:yes gene_type:complete